MGPVGDFCGGQQSPPGRVMLQFKNPSRWTGCPPPPPLVFYMYLCSLTRLGDCRAGPDDVDLWSHSAAGRKHGGLFAGGDALSAQRGGGRGAAVRAPAGPWPRAIGSRGTRSLEGGAFTADGALWTGLARDRRHRRCQPLLSRTRQAGPSGKRLGCTLRPAACILHSSACDCPQRGAAC